MWVIVEVSQEREPRGGEEIWEEEVSSERRLLGILEERKKENLYKTFRGKDGIDLIEPTRPIYPHNDLARNFTRTLPRAEGRGLPFAVGFCLCW